MYRFGSLHLPTVSRPSPRIGAACGEALQSLNGSEGLRDRFFAWRGASGRRYVCSVFQAGEAGFIADVTEGLIVGVARDGTGARAVCLHRAGVTVGLLRQAARECGATEWHVLFGASEDAARDLAGSLLN